MNRGYALFLKGLSGLVGKAYSDDGCAAAKEKYARAIEDFDTAIQLDPKYSMAYVYRGVFRNNEHRGMFRNPAEPRTEHDQAIADFDKAISLDPKNALAYSNRAQANKAKNNFEKAIDDYSSAIQFNPTGGPKGRNYRFRGVALNENYEYDRAIKDFGTALMLDPKNAKLYEERALCWENKAYFDKATEDYETALRLDSSLWRVRKRLEALKK